MAHITSLAHFDADKEEAFISSPTKLLGRGTGDDNALGNFTTAYLGDTDQPTLRTIAGVPYQVAYQYESNLGDRRLKAILNQTVSQGVTTPVEDYTFTSNDDGLFLSRAANDGSLSGPTGGRHRGWKQGHHYGWDHAPHWGVLKQLLNEIDNHQHHSATQGHAPSHGGGGSSQGTQGTTTQYTYDADLRLTAAQGGSSESYTYDPAGNITDASNASGSTSYLVNELNQIESANSTNYTYNADGELVDDGTNTYTWDAAGNLREITNNQSGHTSQFAYDGFGRRISDTETDPSATPVTTRFLWCGLHLCEKRDSSDTVLARYYPQGELQGGQVLYYAKDQVGSVTAVVDPSGQVVGRLSYDSYGNITSSSGTLPDFRYAGLFYHQPTGLELAVYRAYNPLARRWISRDPLREYGGLNLYAYVNGNPVTNVDPRGQAWFTGAIGLVAGAGAGYTAGGWKGAIVGGVVGGVVGFFLPQFSSAAAEYVISETGVGEAAAAAVKGATTMAGGAGAGAFTTVVTNWWKGKPLTCDVGWSALVGGMAPLSGEAMLSDAAIGEMPVLEKAYAAVTGATAEMGTAADPGAEH